MTNLIDKRKRGANMIFTICSKLIVQEDDQTMFEVVKVFKDSDITLKGEIAFSFMDFLDKAKEEFSNEETFVKQVFNWFHIPFSRYATGYYLSIDMLIEESDTVINEHNIAHFISDSFDYLDYINK